MIFLSDSIFKNSIEFAYARINIIMRMEADAYRLLQTFIIRTKIGMHVIAVHITITIDKIYGESIHRVCIVDDSTEFTLRPFCHHGL